MERLGMARDPARDFTTRIGGQDCGQDWHGLVWIARRAEWPDSPAGISHRNSAVVRATQSA